jgi:hypothetical protein
MSYLLSPDLGKRSHEASSTISVHGESLAQLV